MCRLEITNEKDGPLEIAKVVYNGEYEAPLIDLQFVRIPKGLPVKLTIGESANFLCWSWGENKGYEKKIVYVVVHTNMGVFRIDSP